MTENQLSRRAVLNANDGFGSFTANEQDQIDGGQVNIGIKSERATQAVHTQSDTIDRVFDWGGDKKTISGQFPEDVLEQLRGHPDVRYIEKDGTMEAIGQRLPWGVDRIDADIAHSHGETGGATDDADGGHIAIIDTGIDSDHPDLQANLGTGKAFVSCQSGPNDCHYEWDDDHGHGTHCAGIAGGANNSQGVVGVSTQATLHAVKVLSQSGMGAFSDIAAGLHWVAEQGYDVASMSLGGGKSFAVEDAVEYAYESGVLVVTAAGNAGPCADCVGYPAREPEAIAVSATDEKDTLAGFSSTGPQVDIAAPGQEIYSTFTGGTYETLNGTSMACPHVASAGALLMNSGQSNTEARKTLEESAEDIDLAPNEQGYGLLDVANALGIRGNRGRGRGRGGRN